MSIINSQPLIGASGNQSTAYNLTRSLRFRSSASAYLNRTPASAGNRRTWTWSAWVKRGTLGTTQYFLDAGTAPNTFFRFTTANTLYISDYTSGPTYNFDLETTQVFRDPSAWYHLVVSVDTTQATSSNRVKIYINGSQVTAFGTATYPSQNHDTGWNASTAHRVGSALAGTNYFDGYMAEVNFVDGQALTPSDFGETDTATGVWKPKKYTGTYGTNGFYLKFDNLTSTSTLGNDSSGNSNTWTVNNISLTSGSTYDSMKDVPTLTDADTANTCVWNAIFSGGTLSAGNLNSANNDRTTNGTMGMSSGKFYWEVTVTAVGTQTHIGLIKDTSRFTDGSWGSSDVFTYVSNGNKYGASANVAYGASYTTGDVIGIALDMTGNTLTFYKNGTSQGTAFSSTQISGLNLIPMYYANGSGSCSANFGQQPFAYTPPSGYVALNTFNLPTPTIGATASTQANKYFDVKTYTGTGSSLNITGLGFQPDLVWIKERNAAADHALYDAVRGVQKQLESNTTDAETTESTGLTAFNSDGFTVGALAQVNTNTDTYVAWNWDANGAGSSNTAGSITSTVSVNATAGFSVVTYTGTSGAGTVGHGLGVAPAFIIAKSRNNAVNWITYHQSTGKDAYMNLNTTNASASLSNYWGTSVNSTTFGFLSNAYDNANGNVVAYCFAEVAGYSKFGSYTGNGSSDGPFIYTGFRPKFVMLKISSTTGNWYTLDTSINPYNESKNSLNPNTNSTETTDTNFLDILSNGFKLRTSGGAVNGSGATIIYAAFAENPLKYSLAR